MSTKNEVALSPMHSDPLDAVAAEAVVVEAVADVAAVVAVGAVVVVDTLDCMNCVSIPVHTVLHMQIETVLVENRLCCEGAVEWEKDRNTLLTVVLIVLVEESVESIVHMMNMRKEEREGMGSVLDSLLDYRMLLPDWHTRHRLLLQIVEKDRDERQERDWSRDKKTVDRIGAEEEGQRAVE